jgi:hypothetical protein
MLKRAILILYVTVLSGAGYAQDSYYEAPPKVFEGGLAGGLNFTQVDGDTFYGYHKVAINAGALVYVHFTKVFGVSMELNYTRKGSRGEVVTSSASLGDYVEKYFMNLNYVEVPLLLHVVSHRIDFEAGASYARLINSSESVEADHPVVIDPDANRFNTSDVDLVVGIGRQIYKHWYANGRFQYSLTSIRPPERIPVGYGWGNSGQYNNMFALRVLYVF